MGRGMDMDKSSDMWNVDMYMGLDMDIDVEMGMDRVRIGT